MILCLKPYVPTQNSMQIFYIFTPNMFLLGSLYLCFWEQPPLAPSTLLVDSFLISDLNSWNIINFTPQLRLALISNDKMFNFVETVLIFINKLEVKSREYDKIFLNGLYSEKGASTLN